MEKTLELLSDYEECIGKHFEGLESFRPEEEGVYLWTFQKLSYGGYNLQIQFRTRFEKQGDSLIKIISVPSKTKANLSGQWTLKPSNEGTRVEFEATLVGELPLPALMKSVVSPIAQKEVKKIFDRYIENVANTL